MSETRLNLHEYIVTAYNNNKINLWLVIIKDHNQVFIELKVRIRIIILGIKKLNKIKMNVIKIKKTCIN